MRFARSYSDTCDGSRDEAPENLPVRAENFAVNVGTYEGVVEDVEGWACARDGSRKASSGSIPPRTSVVRDLGPADELCWGGVG